MTMPMTRDEAWALVTEWTASDSLRRHMFAVETAMRAYAERLGGDVEQWGVAGLLHDFDYERHPNAERSADREHPSEGVRHLRTLGVSDEICDAILGHADYTGVARTTPMAKALFAVDELTGLITATAYVKPTRSVHDVDAKGVRKRMKDKAFARGVSRDDIVHGAAELGVDLDEHIAFVIGAMQRNAGALGLQGTGNRGPGTGDVASPSTNSGIAAG
jgi:putative nucleotidyltransferase with HDIG domain